MRLNKQRFYAYLLCLFLALTSKPIAAQARNTLNNANLVTISALSNASTEFADSINLIPQLFFQVATLIDEQSDITSRRTSDNTLVNAIEKFSFVAKGVFNKENALGAKSYEIAVTAESKTGRIALYSDANFQLSIIIMRWRSLKDASQFKLKRLMSSHVKEENLCLKFDGSGFYEVTRDNKIAFFLKWNDSGKITTYRIE